MNSLDSGIGARTETLPLAPRPLPPVAVHRGSRHQGSGERLQERLQQTRLMQDVQAKRGWEGPITRGAAV